MVITIVIPIYNRKELLNRTLNSILESTFRPIKMILVDNGSTDGSMELCEEFKKKYESETIEITIAQESRNGACCARNKGLDLCTTEYVYFFDSDDLFDKDFLHDCSQVIEKGKPDMLICKTNMCYKGQTNVRFQKKTTECKYQILASMLSTQSMVFKKDYLLKIGKWNEDVLKWNDWELGVRALINNPTIAWLTDKAYHTVFVHENSITGKNFSGKYKDELNAIDAVYNVLTNQHDKDKLILRAYILLGLLEKEKHSEAIQACKQYINQKFGNRKHLQGSLLAKYVGLGGRAAWRLALIL